jgi:hypothetical protein
MASFDSRVAHPEAGPGKDDSRSEVKRILDSALFRNSDSSRQLLTFLADWSLDHPGQHVKESEIAVTVFHRDPGSFDSQSDSVVRVQMARLRAKILDYYAGPGAGDDILIDIPKGAYYLVTGYREAPEAEVLPETVVTPPAGTLLAWYRALGLLAAGVLLGSAVTALLFRAAEPGTPPHLAQFWASVLPKTASLLVVYSNPRLSGRLAYEGLHYYREGIDSLVPGSQNLSYAGAGDVRAVHDLTRLFDSRRQGMQVRSGAQLSWEQAKESDLIFIGRPEQNPALRKLPRLHEFYFKFGVGIVNLHPKAGERDVYACSDRPYTEDYAVIAFIPGLDPARHTLILAGNTTYGSEAAAEFVTRESSVQALLEELQVRPGQKLGYFEVLLQVRINNEIPVWSRVVAKRTIQANQSSWEAAMPDEQ